MSTISTNNLLTQSPFVYLQAAGSDGADGSSPGIHLRWDFLNTLRDQHIPKGNLATSGIYQTDVAFNRADDFVKVYRTTYNKEYPILIDFTTDMPSHVNDSAPQHKEWRYNGIVPVAAIPGNTCNVILRFTNITKYRNTKSLPINPYTNPLDFIKAYNDIIEVEVEDRFMFSAEVFMVKDNPNLPAITRVESISKPVNINDGDLFISCKKKYGASEGFILKEDTFYVQQEDDGKLVLESDGSGNKKVVAENIQYIRFKGSNCFPQILKLETYDDFLLGKNLLSDWTEVGKFALSVNDTEVYNRIENPISFAIDNKWPKYNEGDKVNAANYRSRWSDNSGLKQAVGLYLLLSKSAGNLGGILDGETYKEIPDLEIGPWIIGDGRMDYPVNTLDMLRLTALDYHVARMLGMGHVDGSVNPSPAQKYIYICSYETTPSLGDGYPAELRTHTYMTLPTGKRDYKLPPAPVQKDITYGIFTDQEQEDGSPSPAFTDENGYSLYDGSRAVNVNIEPFDVYLPFGPFFVPDEEYSYEENTVPVAYGIEYKTTGESTWRKPEISNDPEYKDHNGRNESSPIFATDSDTLLTHIETESGFHEYGVYGINWFSRVSPLSNIKQTDETQIKVITRLIPPLNFGVTLIQKEKVRLFTTEAEQQMLDAISGDKTLVRAVFDWNDIHYSNYWYGKTAEFFFRENGFEFIRGSVLSVETLSADTFKIRTTPYTMYSQNPPMVVTPAIAPGTESHYIGSIFTIDETQYLVTNVIQSAYPGQGPVFTIQAPSQRSIVDTDLSNTDMSAINDIVAPVAGKRFAVAENATLAESWPTKLQATVLLKKLSDHTEQEVDHNGELQDVNIGGIHEAASIVELEDIGEDGQLITNSRTGYYIITFNSYVLAPHGDSNVSWYRGKIRIPDGNGKMRVLDVLNIDTSQSTLRIAARDASFQVNQGYQPTGNYMPIPTGSNIYVNFHPGYRVYFTVESNFDETIILPGENEETKQTFMSCRSKDEDNNVYSYLCPPSILLARTIITPLQPLPPSGPLYATRPDFYGKATYTFETKMNPEGGASRVPYALVFYRASEQIILDTLYKPETVSQILENLAALEEDPGFTSRYHELVNGITDANGFKEWNGYKFPNPDNDEYRIPDPNPNRAAIYPFNGSNPGSTNPVNGTKEIYGTDTDKTYNEVIKLAINGVFFPLTEQPVLYSYVKNDTFKTSNRKPVIRDDNGELMIPGRPGSENYDPAPMAIRYVDEGDNIVRFTDFTLDGASRSVFFYYAVEMGNALDISERSEILGPIQLVNTNPPKSPEIKKFYTQPANVMTGDEPAIVFEINSYLESDGVNKVRIYRAFNAIDAMSIRTMTLANTIDIQETIMDDFSDMSFAPFGDALYYRLVAVRTIINEFDELEEVPSTPTSVILTNIIDVINPEAPELTFTPGLDSTPELLKDVVVEWNKTTHNGTYYLYQMTASGNWTKIYEVASNDATMQYTLEEELPKEDEDELPLYYRFKVSVENASGLLNIEENEYTL